MSSSRNYSIIEYHSKQERYKCGYCKSPNTSHTHGMTAESLTVQHYQYLIDRGWRRSGSYCYKPMMKRTCCPLYTIKCEALDFKTSKSQRKIIKRVVKFVNNELGKGEEQTSQKYNKGDLGIRDIPSLSKYEERAEKIASELQVSETEGLGKLLNVETLNEELTSCKKPKHNDTIAQGTSSESQSKNKSYDPDKGPQKKAKLMRIERKRQKLINQGKNEEEIEILMKKRKNAKNQTKSLEELLEAAHNGANKLEIRLVKTKSECYKNSEKETFELYQKYQVFIHKDKIEKLTERSFNRFLVRSPLRVNFYLYRFVEQEQSGPAFNSLIKLVRVMSEEFIRTFDQSASLFARYQMAIHHDSAAACDKQSYISFLVHTPLQTWCPDDDLPQGYGSFHQQYWLNGTLIAVGVIDILPHCLSSVYFFYDPRYSFLSLGTFSSLEEIHLIQKLNKSAPNFKYYYMGYYIHSCAKMRYKAKIKPSYLLCPETYVWFSIDQCLPKLDVSKYSRFNDDLLAIDEDAEVDIEQVPILYRRKVISLKAYLDSTKDPSIVKEVAEYASLVGKKCALSMIYYVD